MVDNTPERDEDELFDELERKMYSGKRAYVYTAGVILTTLLAGLILVSPAQSSVAPPVMRASLASSAHALGRFSSRLSQA